MPKGRARNKTVEEFVAIWNSAEALGEVARRCGRKKDVCSNRAMLLRKRGYVLKMFPSSAKDIRQLPYLPTEEEIRQGCQEVQAMWTAANREMHRVTKNRPVELRENRFVF